MAAPQQFAQAGGTALFYVPTDGQAPNAAAAFIAAMTQQRVRNAEDMLARRLAALDPSARNAQLAELAKVRADLVGQLAASERTRTDASAKLGVSKGSNFDELMRYASAAANVSGSLSEAEMRLEASRRDNRALGQGGATIVTDVQGSLARAGSQLRDALQLSDPAARKAAANQVYSDLVPRLGAASRAMTQLPDQGEQDAVADRINELAQSVHIGDPTELERFTKAVGTAFVRPGTIATARKGFIRQDPTDIARQTVAVNEILGTGASGSASAGSGVELSQPIGRQDPADSDAAIRDQLTALDALEQQIRAYDPRAALGGLYDPYPGARREAPVVTRELLERQRDDKPDRFARATGQAPPSKAAAAPAAEPFSEFASRLLGSVTRRGTPAALRLDNKQVGLIGPEEPPAAAKPKAQTRLETANKGASTAKAKPAPKPAAPPAGSGAGDLKLREQQMLDELFGEEAEQEPTFPNAGKTLIFLDQLAPDLGDQLKKQEEELKKKAQK